ncbi:hypothetical protein [uncultured Oscillibacter sp.]|uniref:hypothetical protein n=1 Tax=uncultured Oscillibacter sp. TaxID=876091 RepID=UPI0025E7554F|nr:hypothetical protein [uncultured Oscillibacter sp.]
MKKIAAMPLLAIALVVLSACGDAPEGGESTASSSVQVEVQSAEPSSAVAPNPVKDYMSANFDGEYDVITTNTRTEVRVYGLSKDDTEALVESLTGLAENIVVSDYSDDSSILYTYQNGKLAYDSENPTELKTQGDGTMTLEIFKKIKNGMTYNDVVNLVGGDGSLDASGGTAEYKTEIYSWPCPDDIIGSANVTFQGDVVVGKAQFGLE